MLTPYCEVCNLGVFSYDRKKYNIVIDYLNESNCVFIEESTTYRVGVSLPKIQSSQC